jgi:hypothetical protein
MAFAELPQLSQFSPSHQLCFLLTAKVILALCWEEAALMTAHFAGNQ